MKSNDWKRDRKALRIMANDVVGRGTTATMVYVLISHMREKLHMRTFAKYYGGWRSLSVANTLALVKKIPPEFKTAYGTSANLYYRCAVIRDLNDQAEWIRKYSQNKFMAARLGKELVEIAERVLAGYPEEKTSAAAVA